LLTYIRGEVVFNDYGCYEIGDCLFEKGEISRAHRHAPLQKPNFWGSPLGISEHW
jgi:hypothetical protein